MAFNPPIAPPRPLDLNKSFKGRHTYVNDSVKDAIDNALERANTEMTKKPNNFVKSFNKTVQ